VRPLASVAWLSPSLRVSSTRPAGLERGGAPGEERGKLPVRHVHERAHEEDAVHPERGEIEDGEVGFQDRAAPVLPGQPRQARGKSTCGQRPYRN